MRIGNRDLLKAYKQKGNMEARNQLIVKNINLVRKIASKKKNMSILDYEDLVQEGIIGMIKGIEKFDINKKTEFSTYVYYWIDQNIERAILEKGFTVRLPVYINEKINRMTRFENQFTTKGKEVNEKLLCSKLGFTKEEYYYLKEIRNKYKTIFSLNSVTNKTDSLPDTEVQYVVFYQDEKSIENLVFENMLKELINSLLSILKPKEKDIIKLRFGLKDGKEYTLEEIGKIYGVTRERIRQIESKAINKLKHYSKTKYLKDFIYKY